MAPEKRNGSGFTLVHGRHRGRACCCSCCRGRVGSAAAEESPSQPDDTAITRKKKQHRPPSGAGGDGDGADAGAEGGGGRVLSTMSRIGCAAKVVQMGRVTGSDSFKVRTRRSAIRWAAFARAHLVVRGSGLISPIVVAVAGTRFATWSLRPTFAPL